MARSGARAPSRAQRSRASATSQGVTHGLYGKLISARFGAVQPGSDKCPYARGRSDNYQDLQHEEHQGVAPVQVRLFMG